MACVSILAEQRSNKGLTRRLDSMYKAPDMSRHNCCTTTRGQSLRFMQDETAVESTRVSFVCCYVFFPNACNFSRYPNSRLERFTEKQRSQPHGAAFPACWASLGQQEPHASKGHCIRLQVVLWSHVLRPDPEDQTSQWAPWSLWRTPFQAVHRFPIAYRRGSTFSLTVLNVRLSRGYHR